MQTSSSPPASADPAPLSPEGYRTSPDHQTTAWPPGVPYIVGNEACERFSFYGMRAILAVHLASLFAEQQGLTQKAAQDAATAATHLFNAGVYALPMIGAIIAERLTGKYRMIFYLSLVYCLGHVALSIGENRLVGMFIGLALIAVGSGGIKPCVSANVGDQFGKGNWFRVRTVFQIFYFSINFGSFFATLLIPYLRDNAGHWVLSAFPSINPEANPDHWLVGWYSNIDPVTGEPIRLTTEKMALRLGTSVAFGVPAVLMFLATFVFWLGRRKFVHVPPKPGGQIGLLDAISSILLFLSFGHLFITPDLVKMLPLPGQDHVLWAWPSGSVATTAEVIKWAIYLTLSVAFLAVGLVLFGRRQKIQQDDGFLAIALYAWKHRGERAEPAADGDGLSRHWFWGPAVPRFGAKAVEGPVAVVKIVSVFFLISVFWALFDQHSSSWIFQAKDMDRHLFGAGQPDLQIGGMTIRNIEVKESQVPALNPLMVMVLIPLMNLLYGLSDRAGIQTTPLRRITGGMFISAASFVAVALLQAWMDTRGAAGESRVWFMWQVIPYLLITIGEVMVSITGLEFAYTQAPARMKSTIMGFWLLTVALGNVLVAFLAGFEKLPRVNFFWVFAGLSAGAGLLFALRAYFYQQKDYTQE